MHWDRVMKDRNYYLDVLKIEDQASQSEIKKAYHRLARRFHPDLNPNDPYAGERFQLIREAYEFLLANPAPTKSLVPRPKPQPPAGPAPFSGPTPPPFQAPPPLSVPAWYMNPLVAVLGLGLSLMVSTAMVVSLLSKNKVQEPGLRPNHSLGGLETEQTKPMLPPQELAGRKPSAVSADELLTRFSRRGALGNIISVDSKTGKCPKRSAPASYEKRDVYLTSLCIKKFLNTETVVEDVKLASPTGMCEKGYSQNAVITKGQEVPQTVCVKVVIPQEAKQAVVRIYESDERSGCQAQHEIIGVREGGKQAAGRRRVFCQELARL